MGARSPKEVTSETVDRSRVHGGNAGRWISTSGRCCCIQVGKPELRRQQCRSAFTGNVAVRSLATHTVTHYAPSSTQIGQWNNGSEFRTRTSVTQLQSTSWKVTSTGSLNSPGTYAFCWGN